MRILSGRIGLSILAAGTAAAVLTVSIPSVIGERFRARRLCHSAVAASCNHPEEARFGFASTPAEERAGGG